MDDSLLVGYSGEFYFFWYVLHGFVLTDSMEPTIGGGIVIKHDMV
jgi:hypothetical protein